MTTRGAVGKANAFTRRRLLTLTREETYESALETGQRGVGDARLVEARWIFRNMISRKENAMENTSTQQKWYDKTWLVILLCVIFFPVGLYALWKNQPISKGWKIGVTIIIALIVISQLGKNNDENVSSSNSVSSSSAEQTERKSSEPIRVGIGEVLQTNYFAITVNEVNFRDSVRTGNQFADLNPEQGNMYLIINVSFKNTDSESRMLMDGSVWINYNGRNYEFDKSETVLLEGWGLLLDQINPLTTKTTNLVYKIPAEIKGPVYWQPGRANKNQRIFLGDLE